MVSSYLAMKQRATLELASRGEYVPSSSSIDPFVLNQAHYLCRNPNSLKDIAKLSGFLIFGFIIVNVAFNR